MSSSPASSSPRAIGGRQLEPVALHEAVLVAIRQAIVAGSILPGEIHSARALARELGVSQTPVREAMLKLVSEGVMARVPTRGFQLVALSDAELAELSWIRALLEPPAIKLAAEKATESELQRTERLLGPMASAADRGDFVDFFEIDRTFHLELVRLSGREHLVAIVEQLRDRTLRYGIAAATSDGRGVHRLLDDHRQLLLHLKAGSGDAAAALLYDHILGSQARNFLVGVDGRAAAGEAVAAEPGDE